MIVVFGRLQHCQSWAWIVGKVRACVQKSGAKLTSNEATQLEHNAITDLTEDDKVKTPMHELDTKTFFTCWWGITPVRIDRRPWPLLAAVLGRANRGG